MSTEANVDPGVHWTACLVNDAAIMGMYDSAPPSLNVFGPIATRTFPHGFDLGGYLMERISRGRRRSEEHLPVVFHFSEPRTLSCEGSPSMSRHDDSMHGHTVPMTGSCHLHELRDEPSIVGYSQVWWKRFKLDVASFSVRLECVSVRLYCGDAASRYRPELLRP